LAHGLSHQRAVAQRVVDVGEHLAIAIAGGGQPSDNLKAPQRKARRVDSSVSTSRLSF
jgi:hypothetical protein